MSFVLRKLNQVKQAPHKSLEGYKNRPTRELKVYQKAPALNPTETQSTAWVSPLAFSSKQNGHGYLHNGSSGNDRRGESELMRGRRKVETKGRRDSAQCIMQDRFHPGFLKVVQVHKRQHCRAIRGQISSNTT